MNIRTKRESDRALGEARLQTAVALLGLGLVLAVVAVAGQTGPANPADGCPGPGPADRLDPRLDPNRATWWQLAHLPGAGESLARQIVHMRADRAASRPDGVAFARPDDLLAVHGIGPKKLRAMRHWLRFPPEGGPREARPGGPVDSAAGRP